MDLLSLVRNAEVEDLGGASLGKVFGIQIQGNILIITVDEVIIDGDEDDPDGGEEVDVEKLPVPLLRAVGGPANG